MFEHALLQVGLGYGEHHSSLWDIDRSLLTLYTSNNGTIKTEMRTRFI